MQITIKDGEGLKSGYFIVNKSKYEIKRPSINNDIRFDNLNYKIFTVNQDLKRGVNFR